MLHPVLLATSHGWFASFTRASPRIQAQEIVADRLVHHCMHEGGSSAASRHHVAARTSSGGSGSLPRRDRLAELPGNDIEIHYTRTFCGL